MNVATTALAGVLIVEPRIFRDDRGYFLETYQRQRYAEALGDVEFVQDNQSHSKRSVLRGLHLQRRHPQGKLVHVVSGHVWDVAVDIEPASPTFRRWVGVELSADNQRQLYIPSGYAHGFCVLSDSADLVYKCTDYYRPDDEVGLRWNDPELAIDWPVDDPILSDRDAANPLLADLLGRS